MGFLACLVMVFATAMAENVIVRDGQKQAIAVNAYGDLEKVTLEALHAVADDIETSAVRLQSAQERAIAVDSHGGWSEISQSEDTESEETTTEKDTTDKQDTESEETTTDEDTTDNSDTESDKTTTDEDTTDNSDTKSEETTDSATNCAAKTNRKCRNIKGCEWIKVSGSSAKSCEALNCAAKTKKNKCEGTNGWCEWINDICKATR